MYVASKIFAEDLATEIGLKAVELTKPCQDSIFPWLANFVDPWREILSSLLSKVDLSDVDTENRDRSEQQKGIAALHKWKARKGRKATKEGQVENKESGNGNEKSEKVVKCRSRIVYY